MTLSAEQLEERKHGIGSSEIGAICGLNPFKSPIDIYLEKIGEAEPREETPKTRMGSRVEELLGQAYADERGVSLERGWTMRHGWLVATPDFLVLDAPPAEKALVETKLVGARMLHHWPEDDRGVVRAPDDVVAQVQWQQHVTGARRAEIAVLLGGTDFRIVACHYSPEIAASLEEIGGRFWHDHVLARVPPKPDGSGSYAAYLAKSWPNELKPQIAAPAEATEIAERYEAAHKSMKRAEAEKEQAANELKALIGDTAGLRAQLWQARWSPIDECVVQTYTRKAHRRFSLTTYKGFGQ